MWPSLVPSEFVILQKVSCSQWKEMLLPEFASDLCHLTAGEYY